mmetsp:Transcript_21567/g.46911  ORF Transcript_21567/g.46911 Transcript_21567/m.46911 type:complete len:121 (+) Transcript_21567:135-497(+)|eukprot:CAMPEP_0172301752 /NCGR_PEP_ID=MMETSP1058-20130122/3576_1 /TAXON_ID=83371 /ORGANISM="Detonula confervacea, Strain CCMP 353" /LENGTH=120 /DNA_ID=CAMNT_0013011987 /DNA_START=62 /DNA_END=424 /DNA_ORIENTATION=+
MMASTRRISLMATLVLSVFASSSVEASSTSPSQPQRLSAAEGTFVRGMMAADHQFELYLTVSGDVENTVEDVSGTIMPMHHAVDKARIAAVNFADVVRRRAFSPVYSRQSRQAGRENESR